MSFSSALVPVPHDASTLNATILCERGGSAGDQKPPPSQSQGVYPDVPASALMDAIAQLQKQLEACSRTDSVSELAGKPNESEDIQQSVPAAVAQPAATPSGEFGRIPIDEFPTDCQPFIRKFWDINGDGFIDPAEMQVVCERRTMMIENIRWLKKSLVVVGVLLLVSMVSNFALMVASIELTKEFGVQRTSLTTISGEPVTVSSTDFVLASDGTLVARTPVGSSRRLVANNTANLSCSESPGGRCASPIRVASAEQKAGLSSTLPDSVFQELKSVTLKSATGEQSLKVLTSGFQRVKARTSHCGSVVHLSTTHGRLTLDDYSISADHQFQNFLQSSGLGNLLQQDSEAHFGRRLSSDGMLEGFFNLLEDLEWRCKSQPLERPKSLPQEYIAKTTVKQAFGEQAEAYSEFLKFPNGTAHLLPGFVLDEERNIYKVWQEYVVQIEDRVGQFRSYAMDPWNQHVDLLVENSFSIQLQIDTRTGISRRCIVKDVDETTMDVDDQNEIPVSPDFSGQVQYLGIIEERGMVLRHFRIAMDLEEVSDEVRDAITSGLAPSMIDYIDVDDDPSGRYAAAQPYKIIHHSEFDQNFYMEKEFLNFFTQDSGDGTLEGLWVGPNSGELEGLFRWFNVTQALPDCQTPEIWNATDINPESSVNNTVIQEAVVAQVHQYFGNLLRHGPLSDADRGSHVDPWLEDPHHVHSVVASLNEMFPMSARPPSFNKAVQNSYWRNLVSSPQAAANQRLMDAWMTAKVPQDQGIQEQGNESSPRRLKFGWNHNFGHRKISVSVYGGDAGFAFSLTRDSQGKIDTAQANAYGSFVIWPWPEVRFEGWGNIGYSKNSGWWGEVIMKLAISAIPRVSLADVVLRIHARTNHWGYAVITGTATGTLGSCNCFRRLRRLHEEKGTIGLIGNSTALSHDGVSSSSEQQKLDDLEDDYDDEDDDDKDIGLVRDQRSLLSRRLSGRRRRRRWKQKFKKVAKGIGKAIKDVGRCLNPICVRTIGTIRAEEWPNKKWQVSLEVEAKWKFIGFGDRHGPFELVSFWL